MMMVVFSVSVSVSFYDNWLLAFDFLEQLFILPVGNSVSVHCPIFYMKKFVKVYNPPTNAARMHL